MRRIAVLVLGSLGAVVVGAASVAWACTNVASIVGVTPSSAPAHAPVTVRGQAVYGALNSGGRALEMRWDGVKGPVVARTELSGVSFSVTFPIPDDAAPGVHTIVAVPVGAPTTSVGRSVIEVTGTKGPGAGGRLAPVESPTQLWLDSSHHGSSPGGSNGSFMVGMAMLALGTVGLAGGSAVAVARRRRVASGSTSG